MSDRALHVAVDIGGDRVTAAAGRPDLAERPAIVRLGHSADAASSAVFVSDDGPVYGDAAARRAAGAPDRVLRDYAARIGDEVPLTVARQAIRAEEAYVGVLQWAVGAAVDAAGDVPEAITVVLPAAWGDHRRRSLADALRAHGIRAHFMTTPEAVAHHRMRTLDRDHDLFALYDLGATSCDLAIVMVEGGTVRVLATRSLAQFGGADIDDAVFAHLREIAPAVADAGWVGLAAARRECAAAKEALSFDTETVLPIAVPAGEHLVRLVRDELEALIEEDVRESVAALEDLCARAGVSPSDLRGVALAGGGSRMPRVAQLVSEMLGVGVDEDADPQSLAVRGAAGSPLPVGVPDLHETEPQPLEPAAPKPRSAFARVLSAMMRALLPPTLPAETQTRAGTRVAAETPVDARGEAPPPRPDASRSPGAATGPSGDAQTSPPPHSSVPLAAARPIPVAAARSRRDSRAAV